MRTIVLIAHNLRSSHNVGSLLRTADGIGVKEVFLTGYTPYPVRLGDERLPHFAQRADRQIAKTALGAQTTLGVHKNFAELVEKLKEQGFQIAAIEQSIDSISLPGFDPPDKLALVVGREVEGLESEILEQCDKIIEIPMLGKKESYNVVQAAAMALYHCRFAN